MSKIKLADVKVTDAEWRTFQSALCLRAGDRDILDNLLTYYVAENIVLTGPRVSPAEGRKVLQMYEKRIAMLAHDLLNDDRAELHYSTPRLRQAAQAKLDTSHWHSQVAITFTLKQAVERDGRLFWLTPAICTDEFRRFMQRLNRFAYGNANRRYGKRLRVVDVVEKSEDGRWHIHAVIEPPPNFTKKQFREAVKQCWLGWSAKTMNVWAYRENKIKFDVDAGWDRYLLKLRQKSGHEAWTDCIDWYSLYNPGC